jgi:hypothetical protein
VWFHDRYIDPQYGETGAQVGKNFVRDHVKEKEKLNKNKQKKNCGKERKIRIT